MSQERTEKPTKKKLRDARKKGQIARSRDLALAGASVAATIAMARFGAWVMEGLGTRLATDLSRFGDAPLHTITTGELTGLVLEGGTLIATLVGPIALSTMVVGVMVHGFQGGWSFSTKTLHLKWSRLNPANGLGRFKLTQSGLDTLKTYVIVSGICVLGWMTVRDVVADSPRLAWMSPAGSAAVAWNHVEGLLWGVAWVLGLFAIGDYALQRFRLHKSLKMSKQEIRDEHKQNEGNVEVKMRIRRIQREMSRRRMLSDVQKAAVVITNPTHFAVALEYKRGVMAAPRVLAKGQDKLALAIRERARQHGVPIVENKPLAQALYKSAEVGETIPGALFAAVAEVLAQLIRLKQIVL